MPIRLNLLAEAQAAEEMRRRDPVKRAIWVASFLVAVMLIWSVTLYFKSMAINSEISKVQNEINGLTNSYAEVKVDEKQIEDANRKVQQLELLSSSRFLGGTLLNTLQGITLDDVQLTRLKVVQDYSYVEETKAVTNSGSVKPGKPAKASENITLELDCLDSSVSPGDLMPKFKDMLAANTYFSQGFGKPVEINLKSFSSPQPSPETGRSTVQFKLECRFPEKTR